MEIIIIINIAMVLIALAFAIGRISMRNDYNKAFGVIEDKDFRLQNLRDFRQMYVRLTDNIAFLKRELKEKEKQLMEQSEEIKKDNTDLFQNKTGIRIEVINTRLPNLKSRQFRVEIDRMRIVLSAPLSNRIKNIISEPRLEFVVINDILCIRISKNETYPMKDYAISQFVIYCKEERRHLQEYLELKGLSNITINCSITDFKVNEGKNIIIMPISKKCKIFKKAEQ